MPLSTYLHHRRTIGRMAWIPPMNALLDSEAIFIVHQVCDALRHCQQHGIVHRGELGMHMHIHALRSTLHH